MTSLWSCGNFSWLRKKNKDSDTEKKDGTAL